MRKSQMSVEGLLQEYGLMVAKELNYPKNKLYPQERLKYERELIKRLGGSWAKFCELNGWTDEEIIKP